MNQRIKELAELATTNEVIHGRGFDTTQYTNHFNKEKFAELIVKECIMLLYEDDGATHHEELILEHFGLDL